MSQQGAITAESQNAAQPATNHAPRRHFLDVGLESGGEILFDERWFM